MLTMQFFQDIAAGFSSLIEEMLRELAADDPNAPLRVQLKGDGGNADEGLASAALIQGWSGPTTAFIIDRAASAHTVIAFACDEVVATPGARLMVHGVEFKPGPDASFGERDLEAARKEAHLMNQRYVDLMVERVGGKSSREALEALLWSDTHLSAEEAIELGLVDRLEKVSFESVLNRQGTFFFRNGGTPMSGNTGKIDALLSFLGLADETPSGEEQPAPASDEVEDQVVDDLISRVAALEEGNQSVIGSVDALGAKLDGFLSLFAEAEADEALDDATPAVAMTRRSAMAQMQRLALADTEEGKAARLLLRDARKGHDASHLLKRFSGGNPDVPEAEPENARKPHRPARNAGKIRKFYPQAANRLKIEVEAS